MESPLSTSMSPAVTSLHRGLLLLVLLCASSACTPFWQQSREDSQKRSLQLQQTQLQAMRFADEYSGAIADPVGQFVREATLTEDRLAALNWRLTQSTAAYTIASGPNPVVNAVLIG